MRSILHVDMDAFFAAVEQRDHPEWRGKAVIVGSPPDKRGVVCTCSYEARKFGVRSAMASREAFSRCPKAIFVQPEMDRYQEASRRIFSIFQRYTPLVEPLSIDEAFLDVTGVLRLMGTPQQIALAIRADIKNEVGLNASIGIAHNKFLAKLASEKAKPDGWFAMPESEQAIVAYLGSLNVGEIWGVGKVGRKVLESAGYYKVRDLQQCHPESLEALVGRRFAEQLVNLAFGRDSRAVVKCVAEKSISREHTFPTDVSEPAVVKAALKDLCDEVGFRLRAQGWLANVVRIRIRWSDFTAITRQRAFENAIFDDFSIREMAMELFNSETIRAPVRLIGVGLSNLVRSQAEQLSLFDNNSEMRRKRESLSRAVDTIRTELGSDAIRRGSR